MKKALLTAIITIVTLTSLSTFASSEWLTNWNEAKKTAASENKPILMDFSGSDWCGWCIKLDKEVFSTTEFQNYAKKNLVLFLADFPRNNTQTKEVKAQNKVLMEKYKVQGYPTVFLVDSTGKIILQTGYAQGGPEKYIESLKKALASNSAK